MKYYYINIPSLTRERILNHYLVHGLPNQDAAVLQGLLVRGFPSVEAARDGISRAIEGGALRAIANFHRGYDVVPFAWMGSTGRRLQAKQIPHAMVRIDVIEPVIEYLEAVFGWACPGIAERVGAVVAKFRASMTPVDSDGQACGEPLNISASKTGNTWPEVEVVFAIMGLEMEMEKG